jgi:hypothetical protein
VRNKKGGVVAEETGDEMVKVKLAETEQLLAQAREALDASERKRQIERELWQEGAVDVETAAMLTEATVAGMDKKDVRAAVGDLKRRKPFLFRTSKTGGVMGGHAASDGLGAAAAEARESGDRRALLRYLTLRRGG